MIRGAPRLPCDPPVYKKRPKRVLRDEKWLLELRTRRCTFTGQYATPNESVVPCHIGTYGKGIKSPDNEVLPALNSIHQRMHGGEITVLRNAPPDVLRAAFRALAREQYREWLRGEIADGRRKK